MKVDKLLYFIVMMITLLLLVIIQGVKQVSHILQNSNDQGQ